MASSGVGFWYGWGCSEAAMLEDLLKGWQWGDYDLDDLDQEDIDAVPSVVARLPMPLAHVSPAQYDADKDSCY